ncbi:MAG: hypothetical protein ACRD0K_06500 [Egibacteraceae bacterium]
MMGRNVAQKLIASHLVSGDMTPGEEIGIRIDQTLTQDATGTMVMLEVAMAIAGERRSRSSRAAVKPGSSWSRSRPVPARRCPVRDVAGIEIYRASIGSSANPGLRDFAVPAMVTDQQTAHGVSLLLAGGLIPVVRGAA